MPDEGNLAIGAGSARDRVGVREGMVAGKVPARGERRRSDALPTRQPRRPSLCRRRVKHLIAPHEVRWILAQLVEIVVMIVKVLLVLLVRPPGRAAVEASMHPLGKRWLEGLPDRDQTAGREPSTNLLHRRTRCA